jgi:hypothetical protein
VRRRLRRRSEKLGSGGVIHGHRRRNEQSDTIDASDDGNGAGGTSAARRAELNLRFALTRCDFLVV